MMKEVNPRMKKFSLILIVVMVFPMLAACGPKEADVDPNLIYTQAAETVAAQMAGTLAAQPAATETPEPVPTQEAPPAATQPVASVPTFTPNAGSGSVGGIPTFTPNAGVSTVAALPTSTQIVTGGGDKAQFAYSSPADGVTFSPGEVFQLAIGLLNTGSTSWTQDYRLVYQGGVQISTMTTVSHDPAGGEKETIAPGEKGEFILLAKAPETPGEYTTTFFFYNAAGAFVYEVYFFFKVA